MKWLVFYAILIVCAGLMNGIIEMDYTHGNVWQFTEAIKAVQEFHFSVNIFSMGFNLLKIAWSFVLILWKFLIWDYAFFQGGWFILRIIFIALTTAPFVWLIAFKKLGAEPQ